MSDLVHLTELIIFVLNCMVASTTSLDDFALLHIHVYTDVNE